jgi:hypothetical protein
MHETPTPEPRVPSGLAVLGPWLGESFRLFGAQWPAWVLLGGLVTLLWWLPQGVLMWAQTPDRLAMMAAHPGSLPPMAEFIAVGEKHRNLASMCGALSAMLWLICYPGLVRAALRQARGERIGVADLVVGLRYAWASVLLGIPVSLGLGACFLPGAFVATLMAFALPMMLDRDASLGVSLRHSVSRVMRAFGPMLALTGITLILVSLGPCFCGIGAVVASPLFAIAMVVAYRRLPDLHEGTPPDAPIVSSMPDVAETHAPEAAPSLTAPPTPRNDIACAGCGAYLPEDLARCPRCGHPRAKN